MAPLTLSEIWIYPIKSLGGISLQQAKVDPKGLRYDRRWMLVDDTNKFITQRVFPQLALFKVSIDHNALTVRHQGDALTIPLAPPANATPEQVVVWDDTMWAVEVNQTFSMWFSQRLGFAVKLMFFPEENARAVDPKYSPTPENVGFADAYPLLLIGQASLDDLNQRLETPLPMNRFRPNLVFTGGTPFEEDEWRNFTVGTNRFMGVKPCVRCVLTTVDQETAVKGPEPLRTLATFRKRDNKIYFGQNLIAIDHNTLHVGDTITRQ